MITLNLTANNNEQEVVRTHLQKAVSDALAEKINNGTPFVKDGKTLINKKTLDGYIKYASEEARKQAAKGARSACIEGNRIIEWAIQYFEDDSIEGTLYNEDGTQYKPPQPVKPTVAPAPTATPPIPKPKPKPQLSFFDLLEQPVAEKEMTLSETQELQTEQEMPPEEDTQIELTQINETTFVDSDGVVYPAFTETEPIDPLSQRIADLLDDKIIVR